MERRWKIVAALAIVACGVDQLSKLWARSALADGPITLVADLWAWQLHYNTGSAFSTFTGARIALTIVAVLIVGVLIWMVHRERDMPSLQAVAYGLIVGGAVGNLIDRVAFGKVTDFVLWHYHEHTWPVFNVADACLVAGVGLMILFGFRRRAEATA